ncbi:MAG: hypothetical protein CM15mV51_1060 [uncultured marine virus]|nr:MAG: hypothetical protein CM15mV51_1060 [uncultured marine virus]
MQNALAGVFEKYVKYLGNAKGEFVDTDRGGIVFEKIIDGYSLKNSSNMYYKSIEALNNPEVLNDIFDRTVKTFNDRYKNQNKYSKNL